MSKDARSTNWLRVVQNTRSQFSFGPLQEFRNADGRLHRDNGPAYISPSECSWWSNGKLHGPKADFWGGPSYFYRGICVPPAYITDPLSLSVKDILAHRNSEVRYVGMLIYGFDRLMAEDSVKIIHKEKEMVLFECPQLKASPFRVIRVLNSTPEIDGTYRPYYLIVPPHMKTCQSAVAWTFGKEAEEYHPEVET